LVPGDILIVEEVVGPQTGAIADADPTHRQAVRLVTVTEDVDPLYDQPVLTVTWAAEDALTFPVCLSSRGGPDCADIPDVSGPPHTRGRCAGPGPPPPSSNMVIASRWARAPPRAPPSRPLRPPPHPAPRPRAAPPPGRRPAGRGGR